MRDEARPSYEFGPFRFDPSEHLLLRNGRPVPLTPKSFEVLRVLVQNAGHLVGRDRLLQEVWPDTFVEDGALSRSVFVLRKALGDVAAVHRYIETVPTLGYRFVAPVTEIGSDALESCPNAGSIVSTEMSAASIRAATPADASVYHGRRRPFGTRVAMGGGLLVVAALAYVVVGQVGPGHAVTEQVAPAHNPVTFTGRVAAPALSPDGGRLAYVSHESRTQRLLVQTLSGLPAPGGQPATVFSAPEVGHLRWSPDGSELLVWARGPDHDGLYVVPQMGGMPGLVSARQYVACWSPDGSTIVVGSHLDGTIWLLDRLGRVKRTVSLEGVHWSIWDLDWSPVTDRLAVVSNDYQGRYTIWTVRPDGTDQQRVISEDREIFSVRWAPDGNAIYYLQRANQTDALRKVMLLPGGGATETTILSGLETDRAFDMSRDGRRLAYVRAPFHSNLWTVDIRREGDPAAIDTHQLTTGTSLVERPRVSPDGLTIVFNIGREPRTDLHTMPLAGGTPTRLTFLEALNVAGGWSANGRQIAFASTQAGRPGVWVVDAAGGVPRAVSSAALSDSLDVSWSPGSRILYQQAGNRNYHELDPEEGKEALLAGPDPPGWVFSPVYSPDGQRVAVFWNRRPHRGIWIIDVADRHATSVYETDAGVSRPIGWSPDGRHVIVLEGRNTAYRGPVTSFVGETVTGATILKVPVGGGTVRTVVTLPFDEIGSVSMTPDGRRFVCTVYSSSSDVWLVDDFDGPADTKMARR